jgi:hypothetical protein
MARLYTQGEFVGPGERLTARYLENNLPDDWVVVANKELPGRDSAREIDFIVVGKNVLFLVEEKYWWGPIRGNENGWVLNSGESFRSPLRKVEEGGKRLASLLKEAIPSLSELQGARINVGFVLLSHPDAEIHVEDPRCPDHVHLLGGCEVAFGRRDRRQPPSASIDAVREAIVERLVKIPGRPDVPDRVGPYSVLEVQSANDRMLSVLGQHDDGSTRRLRIVRRPVEIDPSRAHQMEVPLLREYDTLRLLGDAEVAPRVDPFFYWGDDQYWVFPIHMVPGRTLVSDRLEHIPDKARVERVIQGAFQALDRVHSSDVVHRGLNPDRIILGSNNEVFFSDFKVSRIPGGQTIADRIGELDEPTPYQPPEAGTQPALAGPPSDVFSLAASLLFWVTGTEFEGKEPSSELLNGQEEWKRHPKVKGLLRCVEEVPAARPTAREVLDILSRAR